MEPVTGTAVQLPETPRSEQTTVPNTAGGAPYAGTLYHVSTPDAGTISLLVAAKPRETSFAPERAVQLNADSLRGTVVATSTSTVDGHRVADVHIRYVGQSSGKPAVLFGRWWDTPTHTVNLFIKGVGKDEALVKQAYERALATLRMG